MSKWQEVAKELDNTEVVVEFTKADGRLRREAGLLEYQPDKARVRIDKGSKGFRLIGLAYVVSIQQRGMSINSQDIPLPGMSRGCHQDIDEQNKKSLSQKANTMSLHTLSALRDAIAALRAEAPELPIQQLQVLVMVALNEGTTGTALQQSTGMTQASVTRNVNALMKYAGQGREGLGWLEWRPDPQDLRSRPLYVSKKGKSLLEKVVYILGK